MKVLFLIDGAAGTGKSDLVNYVSNAHAYTATKINKYTTRPKREFEEAKKSDLIFISDDEFKHKERNKKDLFFRYRYGGHKYGFYKSEVDEAVAKYKSIFIIVRNHDLIQKLISMYSKTVLVIPVYIYTDMGLIEKRLRDDGYSEDMIKFRLERSDTVFDDYLKHDIYHDVIINRSNATDLQRRIELLMKKYTAIDEQNDKLFVSPTEYFNLHRLNYHKNTMQRMLDKFPYERNFFLMMKFRENNKPFSDFIKSELAKHGFNCVRADDDEWNITNDVYNPIAVCYCCKYGIALFDEPEEGANYNPNVTYELGVMHTHGKKCLILKHTSLTSVPFDLVKNLHMPYTKEIEFQSIFQKWLVSINN